MDYVSLCLTGVGIYVLADTLLGIYNADSREDSDELFSIGLMSHSGKMWAPRYDDC